jgi:hypothetical protein
MRMQPRTAFARQVLDSDVWGMESYIAVRSPRFPSRHLLHPRSLAEQRGH